MFAKDIKLMYENESTPCARVPLGSAEFEQAAISAFQLGGSSGMDPQISPWEGYCVKFWAVWARLLG